MGCFFALSYRGLARVAGFFACIAGFLIATVALAQDKAVVSVNGKPILESELALADAEIGSELGNLPLPVKRRVLVEYLIETQLMAEAAERASLGTGASFDQRLAYWRRKALRDVYFDRRVKSQVSEVDAKRSFDAQVADSAGGMEISVRHILVDNEDKAKEIVERIAHGAEFSDMARQYSKDLATSGLGGSLGTITRGQMAPQFDQMAFQLDKGEVSQPVKTRSGWHIIKVDNKRQRQVPDFQTIKGRVIAALMHKKAQSVVNALRASAAINYLDPAIKAQVEAERRQGVRPR